MTIKLILISLQKLRKWNFSRPGLGSTLISAQFLDNYSPRKVEHLRVQAVGQQPDNKAVIYSAEDAL